MRFIFSLEIISFCLDDYSTMFKARKSSHKVYAGRKKTGYTNGEVPKLFDICFKMCINNIDGLFFWNIFLLIYYIFNIFSNRRNRGYTFLCFETSA